MSRQEMAAEESLRGSKLREWGAESFISVRHKCGETRGGKNSLFKGSSADSRPPSVPG